MAVKVIQESNFPKNRNNQHQGKFNGYGKFNKFNNNKFGDNYKQKSENDIEKKEISKKKNEKYNKTFGKYKKNNFSQQNEECWQYGAQGHFRSECLVTENKN